MRLGIVSDIHGNAAALTRALALMGPVDRLLSLGDSIDQYRFSKEVVRLLRDRDALAIRGNHEALFFGPQGSRARSASWIDRDLLAWLERRPQRQRLTVAGKSLLLVHATPWASDWDYVYPHSPAFPRFAEVDADIVIYGHTHQPLMERMNGRLIVNPGSAGQGRPVDDGFLLSCAVLDLATGRGEIIEFTL